jgi:NAD(P)-dependent dehydrogenase (short-subunit alcohol dehydrogenase family)
MRSARFEIPTQEDVMKIAGSTALVTGANRGLGRHLAAQLRDRGATVFGAARNPAQVDLPGVRPIRLDVTDATSISEAAALASDVTLLVNNAGSSTGASLLTGRMDDIRLEMDTHYFGTLAVTRAFAPTLAKADSSAVLNVLSALSWVSFPSIGAYCSAKSAEWSLTNSLRQELAPQKTLVSALHVGYMDTDMARDVTEAKSDPADIARLALDGIEMDEVEIVADAISEMVRAALAGGVSGLYPQFA